MFIKQLKISKRAFSSYTNNLEGVDMQLGSDIFAFFMQMRT